MEPVTMASISSVFGLIATFFQERRGREEAQAQATLEEYLEWLRRREHTEAIAMLESNQKLTLAIQHLLSNGHDELLERFGRLEAMLSLIMGATEEWGELVKSIDPTAGLSNQAVEMLRWLDDSGMPKAITHQDQGNIFLQAMGGSIDYFRPKEERFFEDDMETLVGLGLLILDFGSRGSPNYTITRAAAKLVKSLPEPVS